MTLRSKNRLKSVLFLLALGVMLRPVVVYAGQGAFQGGIPNPQAAHGMALDTPHHDLTLSKANTDPFLFRHVSKQAPNLEVVVPQVSGIKLPFILGFSLLNHQPVLAFAPQQSPVLRI